MLFGVTVTFKVGDSAAEGEADLGVAVGNFLTLGVAEGVEVGVVSPGVGV